MRDEMFADPWLDARPGPGGAEPEFRLRTASRPADPLSGTENAARKGLSSPPDPLPSRALTTSAALSVGSLLYFVLVGLIAAATIGIFFGAGFLLLVHSGKETVAITGTRDPPPAYGDAARADLKDPPAPLESAALDSTTLTAPPGSPLAQPAAMAEVPLPQQNEGAENSPPGASSSHQPAQPALEAEPASSSSGSPAPGMPVVSSPPFSAAHVPASGATTRRLTRDGRSHHSHPALRQWHPPSSHSAPTLTPPQSAQPGPFDRLLTVLTGRSGSLQPPRTQ
jgi:hypothetical protein